MTNLSGEGLDRAGVDEGDQSTQGLATVVARLLQDFWG